MRQQWIVLQGYDNTIKLLDSRPRDTNENQPIYQANNDENIVENNNQNGTDEEDPVDDDIPF